MKKLLIGLLALSSLSSFGAGVNLELTYTIVDSQANPVGYAKDLISKSGKSYYLNCLSNELALKRKNGDLLFVQLSNDICNDIETYSSLVSEDEPMEISVTKSTDSEYWNLTSVKVKNN